MRGRMSWLSQISDGLIFPVSRPHWPGHYGVDASPRRSLVLQLILLSVLAATATAQASTVAAMAAREAEDRRRSEAEIAAYRKALQENTRARVPLDWARTQENLGQSLANLGRQEGGTARLTEAVAAFR